MKISIMEITPDLAAEFLKRNTGNRTIRKTAVVQYADDLRRGNWKLTHQGVAISPNGRLLDGQHRLSAIVQSGIAAQMVVALDVPEDAYLVMDRGKPRRIADALDITQREAETCAYIARLHNIGSVEPFHVQEVLLNFGDHINDLYNAASHTPKGRSTAAIKAAVVLRLKDCQTRHSIHILEQWRAFILSDFDNMWPSVKSFYRQIIDEPQKGGGKNQDQRALRAWVAFDPSRMNLGKIIIRDHEKLFQEMRAVWRPSWSKSP